MRVREGTLASKLEIKIAHFAEHVCLLGSEGFSLYGAALRKGRDSRKQKDVSCLVGTKHGSQNGQQECVTVFGDQM